MKTLKCSKLKWNHELQRSVFTVSFEHFDITSMVIMRVVARTVLTICVFLHFFSFVVLFAFRFWLNQHHSKFIWTSAFAIVIFRSELCILLGLIFFLELATRRVSLLTGILHSALAGISAVGTKSFDILSFFGLPYSGCHFVENCIWYRWTVFTWLNAFLIYYIKAANGNKVTKKHYS